MAEPTIEIRANRLGGVAGKDWYHLYLVYKDKAGNECWLRGGTAKWGTVDVGALSGGSVNSSSVNSTRSMTAGLSGSGSNPSQSSDPTKDGPYGYIVTEARWKENKPGACMPCDYHPGQPYKSIVVSRGPQCEKQFQNLAEEVTKVQATNTKYNPLGPNSNATVGTAMRNAGMEVKLPQGVWAPGVEQQIDTSKVTKAHLQAVQGDGYHQIARSPEMQKSFEKANAQESRTSLQDQIRARREAEQGGGGASASKGRSL